MKEATGEANITVITIILIGVIAAIGLPIITNFINANKARTCCIDAGGTWNGRCSITLPTGANTCMG